MRKYADNEVAKALEEMDKAIAHIIVCEADGNEVGRDARYHGLMGMKRVFEILNPAFEVVRNGDHIELFVKGGINITDRFVQEV